MGKKEENGITLITQTLITQFYNKKEQYMIDNLLNDMQENKDKYKGLTIIPIKREQVVELLNKGKEYDQLKEQLAEKDLENKKFKYMILELQAKEQDQRHQICDNIRKKVKYSAIIITDKTLTQKERLLIKEQFNDDKETIYDILDQIEKGEK